MDKEQGTMWDYWQEHPRGKTNEQELKELCVNLANLADDLANSTGQELAMSEEIWIEKGLSYATG